MKTLLTWLCLCLPLLAQAAPTRGEGFSIELPTGWQAQQGVMGVPLMARPPKDSDPEGWGQDLLTVTREAVDRRRTCLEGFTLRKLGELSYHAAAFEKLEQVALDLPAKNGRPATLLTLRYREGPRELMAYVLILDAGSHFLTATLTSSPARFEFQRARFRTVVESLRRASSRAARR